METDKERRDRLNPNTGSTRPEFRFERRTDVDWVIRGATALSVVSWLLTVGALLLLDIARPDADNMFTHLLGGAENTTWDEVLLLVTAIVLIVSIISCVCAFIFNMMRMRRRSDKYKKSIIIIGLMTIVVFIIFMINFWSVLF